MKKAIFGLYFVVLSSAACTPRASTETHAAKVDSKEDAGEALAARDAGAGDASLAEIPSFDALASEAHGAMREVLRVDVVVHGESRVTVPVAADSDPCVRVAFAADAPVTAWIGDRDSRAIASTRGTIGPHGPACFLRGKEVSLVIAGDARARVIAWTAP